MARPGITYEQVQAAADKLTGEGRNPTILAVRETIGTGSPNTIQPLLARWRESRPVAIPKKAELPEPLMAAISAEIDRAAAAARAEIEDKLVQAQSEATELATTGESIEADLDDIKAQAETLSIENSELAGRIEQLQTDIATITSTAEREQQAAEDARVALARSQVLLEQQTADIDRYRTAEAIHKKSLDDANAKRIAAEQQAAVLTAELAASERRTTDAATTIAKLEKQAEAAAQAQEKLSAKLASALQDAATARELAAKQAGEIQALRDQLQKKKAPASTTNRKPRDKSGAATK